MGSGASSGDQAWFGRQFGFNETGKSVEEIRARFTLEPKRNLLKSKDRPGRTFVAGVFENPSLGELRERVNQLSPALKEKKLKGKLKVREIVADVSELHILPDNKYALFQSASQFNCLEFPSQHCTPESGITKYCHDHTQGPACAIACAPGTVVRNYFGIGKPDDRSDAGPQRKNDQINNLRDIETLLGNDSKQYFQVENGYTMATDSSLNELSALLCESTELPQKLASNLRIGMQWDTEVVCTKFGEVDYKGEQQLVSQAYCSGCSVSYSRCSASAWKPFASLVLHACFEATMLAGILNFAAHPDKPGARRVYLTAIGGGVFGNDMAWVQDAMESVFDKFNDQKLEVILVSFGRETPEFQKLLR